MTFQDKAFAVIFLACTAIVMGAFLTIAGCQHIPGGSKIGIELQIGSGKPPTFAEAQGMRPPVLINGKAVDRSQYPAIVRISSGGGSCTATVVGKRTILTAAHCADSNANITFKTVSGKSFTAKGKQAPGYPKKDLDLLLADTGVDIDVKPMPMKLERFERKNMVVQLIGYGCTEPGGKGGNDGVLRTGYTKVHSAEGYDLVTEDQPDGAGLCFGDSGGPVLWTDDAGVIWVIGVNSKGNICSGGKDKCRNFTTRLGLDEAMAFVNGWKAPLCLTPGCVGGDTPPGKKVIQGKAFRIEFEE